jgi:hypothetical protein
MPTNRPLVFVDLDDTLFQTARKMTAGSARFAATRDIEGNPNGYMNPVQKQFIDWLLATADVVPVTARSVEAYSRVQLPFTQGAICAHGGVILSADNVLDEHWNARMTDELAHVQGRLDGLSATTLQIGEELGYSLRGWVVEEVGLKHYIVTKHNGQDDAVLHAVLAEVRKRDLLDGLYVHGNGNNLAFLPDALRKQRAVQEWIDRDRAIHGERPLMGFGDSISDLGFMTQCHWWATPRRGQLAGRVAEVLLHE